MHALFFLASLFPCDIKQEIRHYETQLVQNPGQGALHFQLALAYLNDQHMEAAFLSFLKALELTPSQQPLVLDEEALRLYLSTQEPAQTARQLLARYQESSAPSIRLILAMAYANLGDYKNFMTYFYESYPHFADSFLVPKTQGIVLLRLSQQASTVELRHRYQEEALVALSLALERYPCDASLYKILLSLAKEEHNDGLIQHYLSSLVTHKVLVSRGDIYLYVREAISLGEFEIAQKIIDRAKQTYDYSRALAAAQDYLNQTRGLGP